MTRETKVGLLVSCSFLCLVGVVVFCKLRQPDPATGQVAAAAANQEKLDPEPSAGGAPAKAPDPAADGGKPAAAPTSAPGGGSPEPAEQMPKLQQVPNADAPSGIQPVAAVGSEGAPAPPPPPPVSFWNQPADNNPGTKAKTVAGEKPSPPAPELPSPALPAPAAPAVAPPAPAAPAVPPPVTPTAVTKNNGPPAPPVPSAAGQHEHKSDAAAAKGDEDGDSHAAAPPPPTPAPAASPKPDANRKASAPGVPGGEDKTPLAEGLSGGDHLPKAPAPAGKAARTTVVPAMPEPTAAAPAEKTGDSAAPAPPALPSAVPVASPVPPEPAKPAAPPEPAAVVPPQRESGANLGKPVPAPVSATAPVKGDPPPPAVPHPPAAVPAADDAPPAPRVNLGTPAAPPANQFAQGPPPPSGPVPAAVPAATTPPVTPSPSPVSRPPAPQVESFDEESYTCRPGDTFESISRAKYQSPKYAQALLLYNRAHPVAGDSFQGGVTALRIGQAIYLPPAAILEKRFGDAIRDSAPPPAAERPAYSSPAAGRTAAAPSAGGAYRVGGGGEYLRAVAMRALADSERWQEILRLNPSVNPAYPVPPGTVLRLPPDARVPAENMP